MPFHKEFPLFSSPTPSARLSHPPHSLGLEEAKERAPVSRHSPGF